MIKKILIFCICISFYGCTEKLEYNSDNIDGPLSKTINVDTPGSLSTHITDKEKYQITSLTISGYLNGDDLILIKEMGGADVYGNATDGKLETLNISEAYIKFGGKPVFIQDQQEFYSDNYVIQAGLFWNCQKLKEVRLPKSNIKSLGSHVFYNCTALQSVSMPSNIAEIPRSTFAQCESLEEVQLPATIVNIGDYAFVNCFKLKSLGKLPTLKQYGKSSFAACWALYDFEIPMSQNEIPDSAFFNCIRLPIKELPAGVTSIGAGAFSNCQSISNIDFSKYNKLEHIGHEAFMEASLDSTINLPESVKHIEHSAFSFTDISKVVINSDITADPPTFDEYAPDYSVFRSCHKLKEFIVSEGVSFLEVGCAVCLSVDKISLPSTLERIGSKTISSLFAFTDCASIELPENLTYISPWAFACNLDLKEISIPSGIKVIPEHCFSVAGLVNITLPEGLEEIHSEALANTDIESLILPNTLKKIEELAFSGCEKLAKIEIPESLTYLGPAAFEDCGLRRVSISGSLDTLSAGVFQRCALLTTVSLPSTLTVIDDAAFANCSSLENITLPLNLKTIGKYSFSYCKKLDTIEIPSSVNTIENYAFESSDIKQCIVKQDNPLDISDKVFNNVDLKSATLIVPPGSLNTYKQHPIWSKFGTLTESSNN